MTTTRKHQAFTLVEILIVVIILGILAAIVLPKFSSATETARASMLADDLRTFRTQMVVFKTQHVDVPPGCASRTADPTEALLISHMTLSSNEAGATAVPGTAGFRFGPYMREMPTNPVNGLSTVEIIANGQALPAAGDNSHGWIYQADTMTLKADSTGADDTGKLYIEY